MSGHRNIEDSPRCESVRKVNTGDYFLTHVIWRNSYGSSNETGVRSVVGGVVQDDFRLIQHGLNFDFAEPFIVAGLRKGWDEIKITDLVCWLHGRWRKKQSKIAWRKVHDNLVAALSEARP